MEKMKKEDLEKIQELSHCYDKVFEHKDLLRKKYDSFEKKHDLNRNRSQRPVGCYMDPKVKDYY